MTRVREIRNQFAAALSGAGFTAEDIWESPEGVRVFQENKPDGSPAPGMYVMCKPVDWDGDWGGLVKVVVSYAPTGEFYVQVEGLRENV